MLRCEAARLLYLDVGAACASGLSAGGLHRSYFVASCSSNLGHSLSLHEVQL